MKNDHIVVVNNLKNLSSNVFGRVAIKKYTFQRTHKAIC